MIPPTLTARMQVWNTTKQPSLEAKAEMGDYLWQLYDRGLLIAHLPPQLDYEVKQVQRLKRKLHPDTWEKVEEEFQELVDEVPDVDRKALEPFHAKGEFDTPLTEPQWAQFLAALKWPYIAIEKFMEFERLKIDGRLRYQAANPTVPKEQRKADLKQYETQAAKYVFDVVI